MPRLRRSVLLPLLPILCGGLLCVWLAGRLGERVAWEARGLEGRAQLELYRQNLHTLVERFRSLPALLVEDTALHRLLRDPDNPALRQALNERLARLNQAAGSSVLYLLDRDGLTLASSNWNEPSSFVGHDYAFRPYFHNALREGSGRYFAVGVTTGIPGYFFSQRVEDGAPLGVLVVKLELEELQRDWVGHTGTLLISDDHGVVVLSNRPAWRFGHLQPLSERQRERLLGERKYAEQNLRALYSERLMGLDDGELRRVRTPDGERDYFWQRQALPAEDWVLHLLQEPQVVKDMVWAYRAGAGALWMMLAFGLLYLLQRRRNRHLVRRSRAELERLVIERTQELRKTQDDLVQAAKLAALGQMSAALAHELNQPLTALRMQLGSLRLLQRSGRAADMGEALEQIDGLVARMSALTGHLKTFARKSPDGLRERLRLAQALNRALQLLMPRLRASGAQLELNVDPQAEVLGDAIRVEQVLLNLLDNALDAGAGQTAPRLIIRSRREGDVWALAVEDHGGGIAPEHLSSLFDPFFTTKPVGEGLGLGLSISYGILRDLGGGLEAANGAHGAIFTLRLPAAPALDMARAQP
ncbi:MAG TPA: ATP-binding protein [Pseudomonas sp.]|nr:ATP-binding protein [Pseudomonas sp.]